MENEYIRKDHAIRLAESTDGEHRGKDWLVAQLLIDCKFCPNCGAMMEGNE